MVSFKPLFDKSKVVLRWFPGKLDDRIDSRQNNLFSSRDNGSSRLRLDIWEENKFTKEKVLGKIKDSET